MKSNKNITSPTTSFFKKAGALLILLISVIALSSCGDDPTSTDASGSGDTSTPFRVSSITGLTDNITITFSKTVVDGTTIFANDLALTCTDNTGTAGTTGGSVINGRGGNLLVNSTQLIVELIPYNKGEICTLTLNKDITSSTSETLSSGTNLGTVLLTKLDVISLTSSSATKSIDVTFSEALDINTITVDDFFLFCGNAGSSTLDIANPPIVSPTDNTVLHIYLSTYIVGDNCSLRISTPFDGISSISGNIIYPTTVLTDNITLE